MVVHVDAEYKATHLYVWKSGVPHHRAFHASWSRGVNLGDAVAIQVQNEYVEFLRQVSWSLRVHVDPS